MINKWLFSSILWWCGTGVLCAQSDFVPKVIPQSPNAAAIGKYGDVPITLNTGQINPSIPLYEIKLNDFSFPISLSYASSGLKTNETPSWTGLGWTLSATGVINRQLRGLPDETTHGFNGLHPTASTVKSIANGGYSPTGMYSGLTFLQFQAKIAADNEYDSEPDMFVLSCAGIGGKFFFDQTQAGTNLKSPVWIPYQGIKLEAEFNFNASDPTTVYNLNNTQGRIDTIRVVDTKGIKYIFAYKERGYDDDEASFGKRHVNAWYLTKIITPNGHTIDFTYKIRRVDMPPTLSEQRYNMLAVATDVIVYNPGPSSPQVYKINEVILEKITINNGEGGEILFVEETNDRSDWTFGSEKAKALSEVIVKNQNGDTIKSFKFTYAESVNRLLLRSVQEKNGTDELPPHEFEYVQEGSIPPLPNLSSNLSVLYNQDHWGYYNTNNTSSLLPTVSYINNLSGGTDIAILATNRDPDASKSVIGQLSKITYPTQGMTQFEWEGNTYQEDANLPKRYTSCSGTMQAISTLSLSGSGSSVDPVSVADTFVVTQYNFCSEIYHSVHFQNNDDVINADIILTDIYGNIMYKNTWERIRPTTLPEAGETKTQTSKLLLPAGTYILKIVMTAEGRFNAAGLIADATVEFRKMVPPSGSNFITKNAGGVRIAKIKDCISSSGCNVKEYKYNTPDQPTLSSGVLDTSPIYDYGMVLSLPILGGGCAFKIPHLVFTSQSQLPISTTLGNHMSYRYVKVIETDETNPSSNNGYTINTYNTSSEFPDLGDEEFPFPPKTIFDWQRGNLVKNKSYNSSNSSLKETTNIYAAELHASSGYYELIGLKPGLYEWFTCEVTGEIKRYLFSPYLMASGFNYLASTTDTLKFSGGEVVTRTNYEYSNWSHFQPTATETVDSQQKTIRTEMKYAGDLLTDLELGSSATVLNAKNMISIPLHQTIKVDNAITKIQKTYYSSFPLVSKIEVFEGNSTNPQTISLTDYDNRGNLLSFNQNLVGPYTSYLWAYKKLLPIAEIKNATKSQVESALSAISVGGVAMDFDKVGAITNEADLLYIINQLRSQLPNALVTGLTYTHLVGTKNLISPANQTTKFEYDALGRLKTTHTQNGANVVTDMQPVQQYQYHYKTNE
ncbi:hypothetical protein [Runella zeae]|uniref:hypothetical protein n=1 Tax=Runella zeae TaxID=94255 RepID=UPI002356F145|nr:hypothetical protein [Runella zeae]